MRKLLLLLLVSTTAFYSCKKSDVNDVKPVALNLQLNFEQDLTSYNFPLLNVEIKLTNLTNGQINTAKTDATGKITFGSIMPGSYDIEATLKITAADYANLTGTNQTEDVVFNSAVKGQSITDANTVVKLELKTGKIGDWVFKQIYYAGSHTTNGAIFRDAFVEIYNNSNEVLYADSLYFAQVFGVNTKASEIDITQPYFRSDKQFDWSKSIGNNIARANEDYVYAKTIFMIPGKGKDYPVQPGESLIIASTAINHKAPYLDINGKAVSVKDPSLTVDLSKADFEVYLGDIPVINPYPSDIDNPLVPNLKVIGLSSDRDLILQGGGRDSYVLFKTEDNVSSYGKYSTPDTKEITTATKLYTRIPTKYVVDAVETQPPVASSQFPKKLQFGLDATYKSVSKGEYSSQSIIRKTAKIINGRRVLQDTNSSSNDFDELERADATKTVFK